MTLRVSTTGSDVVLNDLGITVVHPTTDRDLSEEFTAVELRDSEQLTTAIQNGNLDVDDGTSFIHADDYDPDQVLIQELDIRIDSSYISNDELESDGTIPIYPGVFPLALNSTSNASKNVYTNGARWITWQVEPGDIIVISGGSAAEGYYTVDSISDQQNLIVVEPIVDSTGGTITIYNPPAATRIGVDDTNFTYVSGSTLYESLASIDQQLNVTGGMDFNRMVVDNNGSIVYVKSGNLCITNDPEPCSVLDLE